MYHKPKAIGQKQNTAARNQRSRFFHTILYGLVAGGSAALLSGCDSGFLSTSSEVVVKAQPTDSTDSFNHLKVPTLGPRQPLQLEFSSKRKLDQIAGHWLFRRTQTTYLSSQGHSKPGSVLVHDRKDSWNGPLLKLPPLEPSQAYRVSVWIHPQDTQKTTSAALVLTRVADGLSNPSKLDKKQMEPNKWHQLSGEFVTTPYNAEQLHTLHVDLSNIAADYLVDDLTVTYAEFSAELEEQIKETTQLVQRKHVRNGDVETGMDYWGHQGGMISRSTVHAYSGEHSILITGRNQAWHGPMMEVHELQDNMSYRMSIFVRLEEGQQPTEMKLTLKRTTDGEVSYLPLTTEVANDSDWVELVGTYSSNNISHSQEVMVYVESTSPNVNYYVDTFTVQARP